jgi:hypothetical protein
MYHFEYHLYINLRQIFDWEEYIGVLVSFHSKCVRSEDLYRLGYKAV